MDTNKSPFFIRMARPSDARECHQIDVAAWGEESAASEEMFLSRMASYAFGNFVTIERATGRIVGSVCTLSTNEKPIRTWWETSGEGAYGAACDPHGDLIVGVNVSVLPEFVGSRLGEAMVIRAGEAGWIAGKRKAVMGSRIPEYRKWQDVFAAEDYIRLQVLGERVIFEEVAGGVLRQGPDRGQLRAAAGGQRLDPRLWPVASIRAAEASAFRAFDGELAFFREIVIDGQPCKLYQLLPGYFPDPDSCDNGVLIGWENRLHPEFKGP